MYVSSQLISHFSVWVTKELRISRLFIYLFIYLFLGLARALRPPPPPYPTVLPSSPWFPKIYNSLGPASTRCLCCRPRYVDSFTFIIARRMAESVSINARSQRGFPVDMSLRDRSNDAALTVIDLSLAAGAPFSHGLHDAFPLNREQTPDIPWHSWGPYSR